MTNHNRFLINGPKNTFIAGKRSLTMKNKSKTNWKIDENTTEKFNRYGIRKYNVGAASVAILSGLFFLGGADAQAS